VWCVFPDCGGQGLGVSGLALCGGRFGDTPKKPPRKCRMGMGGPVEGDIKGVSAAQAQLVEFAGRMNTSQKAIITIQKIHRAMCARNQSVRVEAGEGEIPTLLKRVEPRSNPWDQH
jgi:hypothetical protein